MQLGLYVVSAQDRQCGRGRMKVSSSPSSAELESRIDVRAAWCQVVHRARAGSYYLGASEYTLEIFS